MRFLSKAAVTAGLAGMVGLGMVVSGMGAATAVVTPPKIISRAGSDTTWFAMAGGGFNGNPHFNGLADLYNAAQTTVRVTEIPPTNNVTLGFPSSVIVPAKPGCPTTSPWNSD